jgi:hypothetical protein
MYSLLHINEALLYSSFNEIYTFLFVDFAPTFDLGLFRLSTWLTSEIPIVSRTSTHP